MNKQEQIEDLNTAMPYLRAGAAFLIYLVRSRGTSRASEEPAIDFAYSVADTFLHKLTLDVSK